MAGGGVLDEAIVSAGMPGLTMAAYPRRLRPGRSFALLDRRPCWRLNQAYFEDRRQPWRRPADDGVLLFETRQAEAA